MYKPLLPMALAALLASPAAGADVHESDHDSKSAKQKVEDVHEQAGERAAKGKSKMHRHKDKPSGEREVRVSGKERSELAHSRNAERQEIKEAYEADVAAGGERIKGKKPWWKFWGE